MPQVLLTCGYFSCSSEKGADVTTSTTFMCARNKLSLTNFFKEGKQQKARTSFFSAYSVHLAAQQTGKNLFCKSTIQSAFTIFLMLVAIKTVGFAIEFMGVTATVNQINISMGYCSKNIDNR